MQLCGPQSRVVPAQNSAFAAGNSRVSKWGFTTGKTFERNRRAAVVVHASAAEGSTSYSPMSDLFVHSSAVLANPSKLDKYANYNFDYLPPGDNPEWIQDKQGTWRMYMDPAMIPQPEAEPAQDNLLGEYDVHGAWIQLPASTADTPQKADSVSAKVAMAAMKPASHIHAALDTKQAAEAAVVVGINFLFIALFEGAKHILQKKKSATEPSYERESYYSHYPPARPEKEKVYEPEYYYEFMPQK
mmetsp:Transcript_9124/g.33463  ORF Transcript_9124/g.33463 Transcript_9124/m.33463 type:complete len:244 (-) Transcript_9124:1629-2360(-)